jgi:hypothetical protein
VNSRPPEIRSLRRPDSGFDIEPHPAWWLRRNSMPIKGRDDYANIDDVILIQGVELSEMPNEVGRRDGMRGKAAVTNPGRVQDLLR